MMFPVVVDLAFSITTTIHNLKYTETVVNRTTQPVQSHFFSLYTHIFLCTASEGKIDVIKVRFANQRRTASLG